MQGPLATRTPIVWRMPRTLRVTIRNSACLARGGAEILTVFFARLVLRLLDQRAYGGNYLRGGRALTSVTARHVAFIGDENAGCARPPQERSSAVQRRRFKNILTFPNVSTRKFSAFK